MKFKLLSVLLGLFFCFNIEAQLIDDVRFEGLKRTKPVYLERFIEQTAGQQFDSTVLRKDIQRLKNLNLFYKVENQVEVKGDKVSIIYTLYEVQTLLPIISFGGINGNFQFSVGAVEGNFRGKAIRLGGYYRYYDRHSVHVYLQNKYVKSSRWGYGLSLAQFETLEPLYFENGTSQYEYRNVMLEGLLSYEIFRDAFVQFGGAYLSERYRKVNYENQVISPGPKEFEITKLLLKTGLQIKKIDYDGVYLNGFATFFSFENVQSQYEQTEFFKFYGELTYFKRVFKRGNLATRLKLGYATNNEGPFSPFVADSYVNIRGIGNRVMRGTAEAVLNLEYRQLFFENRFCYVQGVVFSDVGSWRSAGGDIEELIMINKVVAVGGGGVRLQLRKFQNSVFRLDYGISFRDFNTKGFVVGLGQYF